MKKIILFSVMIGFGLTSFAQKTDNMPKTTVKGTSALDSDMLVVIDGNKQYIRGTASLSKISPDNIKAMNILKDSLAIAKYGPDGNAGVIEIETKNNSVGNSFKSKAIDTSAHNLQGKVSGFSIHPSIPNIDTSKKVRYLLNRDFDPKAKPLYVVDGKEVTDPNVSEESIKSIEVIKDASSEKRYGDKGRNGVIIITTKKAS